MANFLDDLPDIGQQSDTTKAGTFLDQLPDLQQQQAGGQGSFLDSLPDLPGDQPKSAIQIRSERNQNIEDNITALKAITPANDAQRQHIQAMIQRLEAERDREVAGGLITIRGQTADNQPLSIVEQAESPTERSIARGLAAGAIEAYTADIPALLGGVGEFLHVPGSETLVKSANETRQILEDKINPQGATGAIGRVPGGIIAQAPFFGGLAEGVGEGILRLAPKSAIAAIIKRAGAGGAGYLTRLAASEAVGVPLNAALAATTPEPEIPDNATPEQVAAIRSQSFNNKLKQFALGVIGDALFSAIPHGAKAPEEAASAGATNPGSESVISPERKAQAEAAMARRKAREAKAAADRKIKDLAKADWTLANPDKNWKDLRPDQKADVFNKYRQANPDLVSNPNSDTSLQSQIAELHRQLAEKDAQLVEQYQMARTDEALGIGNRRALEEVRKAVDENPDMVWLFADSNGLKDINEALGKDVGTQMLADHRDAILQALKDEGIEPTLFRIRPDRGPEPNVFRWGGDEFAAAIPKAKADAVVARIDSYLKDYSGHRSTISSHYFDTLADALGDEGSAKLASKKVLAKALHNIPGRNAEEQMLIDAAKQTLKDTGALGEAGVVAQGESSGAGAGVSGIEGGAPGVDQSGARAQLEQIASNAATGSPQQIQAQAALAQLDQARAETDAAVKATDALPIELKQAFNEVYAAGGLRTPEEVQAFADEVNMLRSKGLPPEQYARELEDVKEDFTPLESATEPAPGATEPNPNTTRPGPTEPGATNSEQPLTSSVRESDEETVARMREQVSNGKPPKKQTYLNTVKMTKPLEEMSGSELERLDNKIMREITKEKEGTEHYKALQGDLDKLMENQRRLNQEASAAKASEQPLPGPKRMSAAHMPKQEENAAFKMFMKANLKRMNPDDLKAHIDDLKNRLRDVPLGEQPELRNRLNAALEEQAKRFRVSGGVVARMPPGVTTAAAGFAYGYMKDPGQDEDRVTNALEWAAIGAVAGTLGDVAYARMAARGGAPPITPHEKIPVVELPGGVWQGEIRKHIVYEPERGRRPIPFLERMRTLYQGLVRRSYAAERFQQSLGAAKLSVQNNAAKLFTMYGRWQGQTENALKYGPSIFDEFGNAKKLDALGIDQIIDMVDGNVESLSDLMAASVKLEQGDAVKTPFDEVAAQMTFNAMPEKYHRARDEARKFSLALADVLADGGVLSENARTIFEQETFYAPLQRILGYDASPEVSAEKQAGQVARAFNPVKARKGGSDAEILAPFQAMVDMIPKAYRAAELNKIKNAWVDAWEAAGKPNHLMREVSKKEIPESVAHDLKIKQLREELKLSQADAEGMVAGLDPTSINAQKGTMRVYRNGVLKSYKMPKEVALALQSLNPEDFGMLTRVLGAPARLASKGITMNPYFVAKMGLYDMWQATLNSQYSFRFGVDNIRGWWNIIRDSPKYRDYLAVGGSHQALYGPGKMAISTVIRDVKASKGTPLEVAIKQIRTMHPVEAYKTLIAPIADAARVGEFLRAKDHGASDLEGVWAAKQVTANYGEVGSFSQMRALQHMTMFLGPAIQVLDQASYRAGINFFRAPEEGRLAAATSYAAKAFLSITLPSMYLWHVNKDDKEINELRQTQTGRKYWFIRSPVNALGIKKGDIIKIPKPPIDGQVFGTSMEAALDKHNGLDPQGTSQAATAVLRDAAFNILPSVGVIPYSLQANQNLNLGSTIIPIGDDELELQYQGAQNASWIARAISKHVAPLARNSQSDMIRNATTPAGIDYIINSVTGMLGQDAANAVSAAVDGQQKGYVPPKAEWPLVSRILQAYPTTRVRSVERFYQRADRVNTVSQTIDYLTRTDPQSVPAYVEANMKDAQLIGVYNQVRQQMANLRRVIVDVKDAPPDVISSTDKQAYVKEYTQEIINLGETIEQITAQVDSSQ